MLHLALPLADRRVLVVEDEWPVACEVAQVLEALGAEVVGPVGRLAGAEEAVWRARPLDGAVLDVQLGADTVYPLADTLLARGVPVLLATGYAAEVLPERFRTLPRLGKPLPPARELSQAAARAFGLAAPIGCTAP